MIAAIIQARMSSKRLPGKVLAPILGRPMLTHQIERVRRARRLDRIVVATSSEADDDRLAKLCEEIGVECHRGPLGNVLERYYGAACALRADSIVRLTADCPLTDPKVIDTLVTFFGEGSYDYASNTLEPTWPHGLDVEIFSFESLEIAKREATEPKELEHVTPYFYTNPDRFRLGSLQSRRNLSKHRWTVDFPEDLQMVSRIFEGLYSDNSEFTTEDVVVFLKQHPEIQALNNHIETRAVPRTSTLDQ